MPLQSCTLNGKKGFKWGSAGTCYVGSNAKVKASTQGRAIESKIRHDDLIDALPIIKKKRANATLPKINPKKKHYIMKYPLMMEVQYNKILQEYVNELKKVVDSVYYEETINSLLKQRNLSIPETAKPVNTDSFKFYSRDNKTVLLSFNTDDWPEEIAKLNNVMMLGFGRVKIDEDRVTKQIADGTNKWNNMEWQKTLKSVVGVDIFQREPFMQNAMKSFIDENVELIGSIKDKYATDVGSMMQRQIRAGSRTSTIAKELQEKYESTQSRARLIARDQVAKFNGQLTQYRQANVGITHYFWVTAEDSRVRPTHEAHNGKRFAWNNPPADTGHPGQDFQCRCIADPDFDPILNALPADEIKQSQTSVNVSALTNSQQQKFEWILKDYDMPESEKTLLKQAVKFEDELPSAQHFALRDYSIDDYEKINNVLSNVFSDDQHKDGYSDELIKSTKEKIKNIQNIFKKDYPKYEGTVYRGMKFEKSKLRDKEAFAKFMDVGIGQPIEFPQFMSTSTSQDVAEQFGKIGDDDSALHGRIFMTVKNSKNGMYVDRPGDTFEYEVLYNTDSKFKVTNLSLKRFKNSSPILYIDLEEID